MSKAFGCKSAFLLATFVLGVGTLPGGCATTSSTQSASPNASFNASPNVQLVATHDWRLKTVVEGLDRPWSLAWLPDGAMLITEKAGRLRIVRNGVLQATPISGVPTVFSSGQGGLMEVSLHPNFRRNRLVYLTYSAGTEESNHTEMARGRLEGDALRDVRVLFRVSQNKSGGQHFGSRIAWLRDGTMLLAIGDGGNPPVKLDGDYIRKQAQNKGSHLGKILRLTADGKAARGNPFAKTPNAKPEVWSWGHRNIQGLAVDSRGRVWANEHGARGGDELNLVRAGANYGWPLATHSTEYWGPKISDAQSLPGKVDPKVVWTPAQAPSGLLYYTGNKFPAWRGSLFSGGLAGNEIRRLTLDKNDNVTSQETLRIGARVRDVRQGPDGFIYVLTDEGNGKLLRIELK